MSVSLLTSNAFLNFTQEDSLGKIPSQTAVWTQQVTTDEGGTMKPLSRMRCDDNRKANQKPDIQRGQKGTTGGISQTSDHQGHS